MVSILTYKKKKNWIFRNKKIKELYRLFFFSMSKNHEYKYKRSKLKVQSRTSKRFLIVFGYEKSRDIYESVVNVIRAKRALVEHTQNGP